MKFFKIVAIVFVVITLCLSFTACGNSPIAGVWSIEDVMRDTFEFTEDGKYILTISIGDNMDDQITKGTYKIDGGWLTIIPDDEEADEVKCTFEINDTEMILTFGQSDNVSENEVQTMRLTRK